MKIEINSGMTLATAAAALLLAGSVVVAPTQVAAEGAKGHCMGANACKGQSACKTATNECAGHNACKGKGYTETTKEECDAMEGTTFEPAKS